MSSCLLWRETFPSGVFKLHWLSLPAVSPNTNWCTIALLLPLPAPSPDRGKPPLEPLHSGTDRYPHGLGWSWHGRARCLCQLARCCVEHAEGCQVGRVKAWCSAEEMPAWGERRCSKERWPRGERTAVLPSFFPLVVIHSPSRFSTPLLYLSVSAFVCSTCTVAFSLSFIPFCVSHFPLIYFSLCLSRTLFSLLSNTSLEV